MIFNNYCRLRKLTKHCYCTKVATKSKYSNTVFLPKTKFPLRLENKKLIERDEYITKVSI